MTAPAALRCAGCGTEGRKATIVWDRSAPEAQLPILSPVFGWDDEARTALLCPRCRKKLAKLQSRRRAP
jgi:hypothetical protein